MESWSIAKKPTTKESSETVNTMEKASFAYCKMTKYFKAFSKMEFESKVFIEIH